MKGIHGFLESGSVFAFCYIYHWIDFPSGQQVRLLIDYVYFLFNNLV